MFACKKTKINSMRTSVVINGETKQDSIGATTVSLVVNSNRSLKLIEDMSDLTYLKLKNTSVNTISDCFSLSILTIDENKKIERIERLDNLVELKCNQCTKLRHINLNNLNEASLEDCTQLRTLVAPRVEILKLIRCTKLKFPKISGLLKVLKLQSCHSIKTLEFIQQTNLSLDYFEVNNCANLLEISGIKNCKEMIVQDCNSVQKIHTLNKIGSIIIDKCTDLTYIGNFNKTKYCSISRCDNISIVYQLKVSLSMLIEYCPKLDAIDNVITPELIVRYCNRLLRLYINKKTTNLLLEECQMLDYLKFDPETKKKYTTANLAIVLKGIFAFSSISTWKASSLTIIDNPNIIKIDTVYDLKHLSVQSCDNIYSIRNMIIESTIDIADCLSLEEIVNIMGPENINLSNLEYLSSLGIDMTSPKSIYIENAPHLKSNLDGSNLDELTLVDTDMIVLSNLSPKAIIKTNNSGYLPDLETNKMNHTMLEATQLIEFDTYQRLMASRIIRNIRLHQVKKYKRRIQLALMDNYCIICTDPIERKDRFVTKCFHIFHMECISNWLVEKNVCPLCGEKSIFRQTDLCCRRATTRIIEPSEQVDTMYIDEDAHNELVEESYHSREYFDNQLVSDDPNSIFRNHFEFDEEIVLQGEPGEIVRTHSTLESYNLFDAQTIWASVEQISESESESSESDDINVDSRVYHL